MKKNEIKKNTTLDPGGFSRYLRIMADAVDGRQTVDADPFIELLPRLEKFSIKIRRRGGGYHLKVKGRLPEVEAVRPRRRYPAAPKRPGPELKYKDLKKRMKADFKQIEAGLSEGRMPAAAAVTAFLRHSDRMLGFAGKGEEFYETYRSACARFADAFEQSDLEAMTSAYAELRRLRNAAHRKYK